MRSESVRNDDCNSNSSELEEIIVELIPQPTPVLFVTSRGLHLRTKKKQSPPTSDSGQGTSSSLENSSTRNTYEFKFCDLEKSWVSFYLLFFFSLYNDIVSFRWRIERVLLDWRILTREYSCHREHSLLTRQGLISRIWILACFVGESIFFPTMSYVWFPFLHFNYSGSWLLAVFNGLLITCLYANIQWLSK